MVRLALPALGALAAEPLYVLADTAIVGHLGRPQIAALGLAGTVLAGAFTTFNFLTYGTTAVVARASGAGKEEEAARLAAQALWASLGIGVALLAGCEIVASPLLAGLGGHGRSGHFALVYFRIAAIELPAALVALAGQGYLRGVSNLRRPLEIVVVANVANLVLEVLFVYGFGWGIAGSAAGTAVAQAGMGAAFVVELLRPRAPSRKPSLREMRPLFRIGRQIFVRTAALYASFLVAASVLARMGDAQIGAHQIAYQLFLLLALVLDAIAIAGQVIVGRMLGAGDADGAHAAAVRMIGWSVAIGVVFAAVLAPLSQRCRGRSRAIRASSTRRRSSGPSWRRCSRSAAPSSRSTGSSSAPATPVTSCGRCSPQAQSSSRSPRSRSSSIGESWASGRRSTSSSWPASRSSARASPAAAGPSSAGTKLS
jgi:putative MATE family efflux protein